MSLLQHQDFVLYRIRNRYLQCMKDGVGERLISLNPTALNLPAFKNAGWGCPSELRRTYSPPIPVGGETEYFANNAYVQPAQQQPLAPVVLGDPASDGVGVAVGGVPGGGGGVGSLEAIAERGAGRERERRRRQVHREVDDSSMSEDSDEEDSQVPPQRIQFDFTKKEITPRPRSGSSPIRSGPQVLITSPSKSRTGRRLRGGSHGDVDFTKSLHGSAVAALDQLPDADEELLSSGLGGAGLGAHKRISERLRSSPNSSLPRDDGFSVAGRGGDRDGDGEDDTGDDSDASDELSSDFTETADSNPAVIIMRDTLSSSSSTSLRRRRPAQASRNTSSPPPGILHALPPPIRPISQIPPISALTQLLQAKAREAANPLEPYRLFSGKGELTPVTLKLYMPYSPLSSPFEVVLNRLPKPPSGDRGGKETTVAEAIGFALWRYVEAKHEPPLREELADPNAWTLRMVDDGEPDEDFPPLERTQPVTAYIVKKSGRARTREVKMEGEFALVEATGEQVAENRRVTPGETKPLDLVLLPLQNPLFPPAPAPATTTTTTSTATASAASATTALQTADPLLLLPKTGTAKIIRIHISTIDEFAQSVSVCVTSDTFIGEVLEQVCRKKHLDKSKYILRLTGHPNVVWSLERTVAALGDRAELDLVRRKAGEDFDAPGGIPLVFSGASTTAAAARGAVVAAARGPKSKFLQPPSQTPDILSSRDYLKFTVWRKASMTFMSRHERILAIDGEYIHIMPPSSGSPQKPTTTGAGMGATAGFFDTGAMTTTTTTTAQSKTTSIHISTVVGCKTYRKQPSLFKIVVLRPQREMKRYDFEAVSKEQAVELVAALRKGMERFEGGGGGM